MSIQIAAAFLLILFFGCSGEPETKARLFKNLGERNHFKITTNSELAQKYFDQRVTLAYGFNHEEAFRSFNEAARLDSNCAMAYWGMAIVLGPNINLPMDQSSGSTAYEAVQKAIKLLDNETQKEKDWVIFMHGSILLKSLQVLNYILKEPGTSRDRG